MGSIRHRALRLMLYCLLLGTVTATTASAQDVTSSPTSLAFPNTYVGKVSGAKTLTITSQLVGKTIIASVGFSCPEYGLSSGVAPITLNPKGTITHYSIFFQPDSATTFDCNFVINLWDGTTVNVPISGTGEATSAVTTVTPSSLSFSNQSVGTVSASQTITVTNNGGATVNVTAITLSPPSFTTGPITLPFTIARSGGTFSIPVYYTPSQVTSETGVIDITYNSIPDNGSTLSGNGVAAHSLAISTSPMLPQATQGAAYEAFLTATGGVGPYTWRMQPGSALPSGLTLSAAGVISGTLSSSVAAGNHTFTVQAQDTANGSIAGSLMTLIVFANLADNCNDISFDVPNTTTPIVALNDLGTGTYQGSEGGLYPNGSNARPALHDADGVTLADGIQPLDSEGNPSPTGKYVLLALGESTAQNEFNRFLPIANADPAKNPNLVIVNGAQGGATPQDFSSLTSYYWGMVTNNYLTQNGVTANQVVAVWMEDTDGIATGTFPTDISKLQSEYESMMRNMHTLFPNLKLVYFSSRVYGGYSNGVGSPDNPEPYAYEVGFAVKWAIQDQINGTGNLNYNPNLGAVVAPWMSWGTYYWSNGMLGRSDGLQWDCADFAADGTHPSSTGGRFGQLKVATQLLNFLKTDDTTTPWYLSATLALTSTGGNNQSGNPGSVLPAALTVLASNIKTGDPIPGVSVTFSDGGVGGKFSSTVAVTGGNGVASTTYTLPTIPQTVNITATSPGYETASFTETATSSVTSLGVVSGGKQVGTVGTTLPAPIVMKAKNASGAVVAGAPITFSDGGLGGTFTPNPAITGSNGQASTSYTLPKLAKSIVVTGTNGSVSATVSEQSVAGPATTLAIVSGNNQSANPNTLLPNKLIVSVTDQYGNGVSGVTVTFTDNGAGGTFSSKTAVTTASGQASVSYTTSSNAGKVTISASTSTLGPVKFTETVN
jgi:hypothetical protein